MDRFKLGKKWFWIGVVLSLLQPLAGLVFAIALVLERERRKEGWILIIITFVLAIGGYYLQQYLKAQGIYAPATLQFGRSLFKEGSIITPTP